LLKYYAGFAFLAHNDKPTRGTFYPWNKGKWNQGLMSETFGEHILKRVSTTLFISSDAINDKPIDAPSV
jgi:hypothetical protein